MNRNELFAFGVVLVFASVLLACQPTAAPTDEPPPDPAPPPTGVMVRPLVIGTTDSWSSFESAWVYSFHDWELFHQCADGLINVVPGSAGETYNALAESYQVSDDGRVYTFELRAGVAFPDGTPFNADAVLFSFNRIATIEALLGANAGFLYTDYAAGVEKIDDMTVAVTFNAAYPFALQLIATNPWKILNPNKWSAVAPGTTNTACGIGPYVLTSFTEGEETILDANPNYYGDAPKEEKVIVRYFADSPTMALALQNAEVDVAWKSLAPADMHALDGAPGITIETAGGTETRFIVYNATTPPYDDPRVRFGLAQLLEREQLTDLGWQGIKVPLYSMVPPGFLGYKPTYQGTENVDAGKALLAAAGFTEANPLVLDLWYSPTHYGDTEADVALVLKQQWEASGVVEANLQFLEWAAYRPAGQDGELPVSLLGWYPDYLDPDNYTNVFAHSPALWSGSRYNNPDMDALLDAQARELDEAERISLLEQVQDLWVTESPYVPLAQGKLVIAHRDNISGVVLDPIAHLHYFLLEKQ